ncbi:MAG: peptidoglycan-binding protein [Micavibrio aeruginosavorus]|nr:peptidoglycan-binding protein [Micavibrio aeruginosavorus]
MKDAEKTIPGASFIGGSVGNRMRNAVDDILKVRDSLLRMGYGAAKQRGNTILTRDMDNAIKAFQKDNNLKVDGILKPGGEAESRIMASSQLQSGKVGRIPPVPEKKPEIISGMSQEEIIDFFKRHEDQKNFMYLDHKGNVTVGAGHMIPNTEALQGLPFEFYDTKTEDSLNTASIEDVRRAFEIVRNQKIGKNIDAESYNPEDRGDLVNIRLPDADVNRRLIADLHYKVQEVRKKFPQFDTYPQKTKMALLDMQFNMGRNFSRQKWSKLYKAVEGEDWLSAAKESNRKDVGRERNEEIRKFFLAIEGYAKPKK